MTQPEKKLKLATLILLIATQIYLGWSTYHRGKQLREIQEILEHR